MVSLCGGGTPVSDALLCCDTSLVLLIAARQAVASELGFAGERGEVCLVYAAAT